MKRNKASFPGIPRNNKSTSSSESALTENVEILTGARGSNRALLLSDLVNLDTMQQQSLMVVIREACPLLLVEALNDLMHR